MPADMPQLDGLITLSPLLERLIFSWKFFTDFGKDSKEVDFPRIDNMTFVGHVSMNFILLNE